MLMALRGQNISIGHGVALYLMEVELGRLAS